MASTSFHLPEDLADLFRVINDEYGKAKVFELDLSPFLERT
jgi:hypothetical protein